MTLIRSKFIKDVLSVGLAQMIAVVLNAVIIRLIETWFGGDQLAYYVVAVRICATLYPLLLLGLDYVLAREVALQPGSGRTLLGQGVMTVSVTSVVVLLVGLLVSDRIGSLVFGQHAPGSLLLATLLFSVGLAFLMLWFSALRGFQRMRLANSLVLSYRIIELGSAFVVSRWLCLSRDPIVACLGLAGIVTLSFVLIGSFADRTELRWDKPSLLKLLQYGAPRIPSGFFLSAVFSVPVLLASSRAELRSAAAIGIGVMLARVVESAVGPLGTMLLPKLSEMARPGREAQMTRALEVFVGFSLHVGILSTLLTPGLVRETVSIWLGPEYAAVVRPISIIMMGTGPFMTYMILRNVLNAFWERPYVTWLTLSSILVTLGSGLVLVRSGSEGLAISLVLGFCVLGFGAMGLVLRLSTPSLGARDWLRTLPILLVGAIVMLLDGMMNALPVTWALILKITFRGVLVLLLVMVLWRWKTSWCREVWARLGVRRSPKCGV